MERCVGTFPIDRFGELLGGQAGTYAHADSSQHKVIDPAIFRIFLDMSVLVVHGRRHNSFSRHQVSI
jgi:hypothetical protein